MSKPAAIGSVPKIPDSGHRVFLQALKENVESIRRSISNGTIAASSINALRAELTSLINTLSNEVDQKGEPYIPADIIDGGGDDIDAGGNSGDYTEVVVEYPVLTLKATLEIAIVTADFDDGYLYGIGAGLSIRKYDATSYDYLSGVHVLDMDAQLTGFTRIADDLYATGCQFDQQLVKVSQHAIDTNDPSEVASYVAGAGSPQGLCVLDGYIWVTNTYSPKRLSKIDPGTMTEVDFISISGVNDGGPSGIATDGTYLYVSVRGTVSNLICVDPATGSIIWNVQPQRWLTSVLVVADKVWSIGIDYLTIHDAADGATLKTMLTDYSADEGPVEATNTPRPTDLRYDNTYVLVPSLRAGTVVTECYDPVTLALAKVYAVEGEDCLIIGSSGTDLVDAAGHVYQEGA